MCERQNEAEYGEAIPCEVVGETEDHSVVYSHGAAAIAAGARAVVEEKESGAAVRIVLPLWLTQDEAEMLVDLCCLAPVSGSAAERALFGKIGEMLRGFYHRSARSVVPGGEGEVAPLNPPLAWARGQSLLASQRPE